MSSEFIKLPCPRCQKRIKLSANKSNKKIVCPACHYLFKIALPEPNQVAMAALPSGNCDSLEDLLSKGSAAPGESPSDVTTPSVESISPQAIASVAPMPEAAPVSFDKEDTAWQGPNFTVESQESDAATSRTEKLEKSQKWLDEKKSEMDPSETRIQQIGFILLLAAVAATLVPFFGLQLKILNMLGVVVPLGGIVLGFIGIGLIVYTLRGSVFKRAITCVCMVAIVSTIGVFGFYAEMPKVDGQYRSTDAMLNQGEKTVENTANRAKRGDWGLESDLAQQRQQLLNSVNDQFDDERETRRFIEVDRPSNPKLSDFDTDNRSAFEQQNQSDAPLESFDPEQHRGALRNSLDETSKPRTIFTQPAGATPQLSPQDYNHKKDVLERRLESLMTFRINRFKRPSAPFETEYKISDIAGKSSLLGRAIYSDVPLTGLDVLRSDSNNHFGFSKIIPITGSGEFSESLTSDSPGRFLSSVVLNIESEAIVGLQAILSPRRGDMLDATQQTESTWFGNKGDSFRIITVDAVGKEVFGIVVYEEKLRIVGFGLITKR